MPRRRPINAGKRPHAEPPVPHELRSERELRRAAAPRRRSARGRHRTCRCGPRSSSSSACARARSRSVASTRRCTGSVISMYSGIGTSFFSIRWTRITSTPASSVRCLTFCTAASPKWPTSLILRLPACRQPSQTHSVLILRSEALQVERAVDRRRLLGDEFERSARCRAATRSRRTRRRPRASRASGAAASRRSPPRAAARRSPARARGSPGGTS